MLPNIIFAVIIFLHAVVVVIAAKPDIIDYNILLVPMDINFVISFMCYQFLRS